MATKTKTLNDGTQCIQVIVRDDENEVRVHWHPEGGVFKHFPWPKHDHALVGLLVLSRTLGTICDVGDVTGECE